MPTSFTLPPAAPAVIVHLFKGVLESDRHERLWQSLLAHQAAVRDYCAVVGLQLVIDEAEGYAYLRQTPHAQDNAPAGEDVADTGDGTPTLPRLIARRPLGYGQSLLCVLLRKRLAEQDAGGGSTRLVLGRNQMVEMIQTFLPTTVNEARRVDQITRHINKLVDYGILRPLKGDGDSFEVRRILKALVDADWLHAIDDKLAAYAAHADTLA
ncbi:MAG: DUF4194 domain-containing protein [Myxococcota bacterium]